MRQKNSKISWINCHRDFGNSPESKKQGIVQRVDTLLAEMKGNGFYLDSRVEDFVLEQAGESPKDR